MKENLSIEEEVSEEDEQKEYEKRCRKIWDTYVTEKKRQQRREQRCRPQFGFSG